MPSISVDARQHRVDGGGQAVELVAAARQGNPARKIAAHDVLAGGAHGIDAREAVAADEGAADEAQRQGRQHRPGQRPGHDAAEVAALQRVAPDEEVIAAGEIEGAAADDVGHAGGIVAPRQRDLQPAVLLGGRRRPVGQVAGQRLIAGAGQQVDVLRHAARPAALVDHLHQAHQPLVAVLLGEAADLGLHRLVGLALEEAGGLPVDEAEQHAQGDAEQQQVEQRDAEDRSLKEPVHRPRFWT
jgi:hypothetical protein